jgi:UDPglucose--hexose-1-phosphate uridylyltransferase
MNKFNQDIHPHRRYNPLLDEWILVSPQRALRPWQGQTEALNEEQRSSHDENCYLCPGNQRSNGIQNEAYTSTFVFENDFSALMNEPVDQLDAESSFFQSKAERGINKVVCFSPNHSLTLAEMSIQELLSIVETWTNEYKSLGSLDYINHVQIFENKGSVMGCSNPHPHGQIWAQESIPTQVAKTHQQLLNYHKKNGSPMLLDYVQEETSKQERLIAENEHFVLLVPFWATWPFETMIVSKFPCENLTELTPAQQLSFVEMIQCITVKYDNLFHCSFPYSAGIHQAPTDGENHPEWTMHMHFYPPLLRSASVKKFQVGYEMLGEAQRDITPEQSAERLRSLSTIHYKTT